MPFFSGLLLGGSLIIAIGAQNAFILRQGLLREHVFVLCLICALSDALLIAAGVLGLGTLVAQSPTLLQIVTIAGAAFLLVYGLLAARRAFRPLAMTVADRPPMPLGAAVSTVLAFTFLNPHVYLDTVVLIGGLSAAYEDTARFLFASGAMIASFLWFFALGYGARLLVPLFSRPRSWAILDGLIAVVMIALAARLAWHFFELHSG